MAKLTNFILDLAEDRHLLSDFGADPEAVMARADLSPAERSLINSRDPKVITEAIIRELMPGNEPMADWTIVVVLVAVTTKSAQLERLEDTRRYEQLIARLRNLADRTSR